MRWKIYVWLLWEAAQLLIEGQCENSFGKCRQWVAVSTQTIFLACKSPGWNSPASCPSKPCTQTFAWLRATRACSVLCKGSSAWGWRLEGSLGGPCAAGDKSCLGGQLRPSVGMFTQAKIHVHPFLAIGILCIIAASAALRGVFGAQELQVNIPSPMETPELNTSMASQWKQALALKEHKTHTEMCFYGTWAVIHHLNMDGLSSEMLHAANHFPFLRTAGLQ